MYNVECARKCVFANYLCTFEQRQKWQESYLNESLDESNKSKVH